MKNEIRVWFPVWTAAAALALPGSVGGTEVVTARPPAVRACRRRNNCPSGAEPYLASRPDAVSYLDPNGADVVAEGHLWNPGDAWSIVRTLFK